MGEFEDLVAKARQGDSEALDQLEEKYGGTALRQQAESAANLQRQLDAQTPLARRGVFNDLVNDLPEELQSVPLSVEEFEDIEPEALTIEVLTERAQAKQEERNQNLSELASNQGFASVEEFQAALEATKRESAERTAGMEAVGAGVVSGSGGPPPEETPEPFDAMQSAYEDAGKRGLSQDKAMGEGLEALLTAKAPVEIEE